MEKKRINIANVVGKGYKTFWNYKGRYRVVKGSRASKKSKTTALWIIYNMMKYKNSNTLVVRKTYRTIKDSCFTELKWAINRLGVSSDWKVIQSPLELEYKTGQKIYFRGLDDPLKITSITCEVGSLCWGWIEEAYEITKEDDFNMLDSSIRGQVDNNLWKMWTLTLNPWNERHWIKKRFFDSPSDEVLALTTNYLCNEFLDEDDYKLFNDMKQRNYKYYKVAGLGDWGVVDGLVYENYSISEFSLKDITQRSNIKIAVGLDFGYVHDPSALVVCFISDKDIYIYDELYETGLSNRDIARKIKEKGYGKENIIADSAEPKSIDELVSLGLRVKGARKGKDSIINGIQWICNYRLVIHPRCTNFINEIVNYAWDKDKIGNTINKPKDEYNHLMDALRYALEPYILSDNGINLFRRGI